MNTLDEIFEGEKDPSQYAQKYCSYLGRILQKLDFEAIGKAIIAFKKARDQGRKIIFIGNGGSAATASHFANDIGIGTRMKDGPYRALSLTDNTAVITAIGNDFGYDYIFSKQLETVLSQGDLLVAISASGNSPNIINAVELARKRGNLIIGLTGFDGGKLKGLSDLNLHVPSLKGEYGPVEDVHMIFDHIIGTFLMRG